MKSSWLSTKAFKRGEIGQKREIFALQNQTSATNYFTIILVVWYVLRKRTSALKFVISLPYFHCSSWFNQVHHFIYTRMLIFVFEIFPFFGIFISYLQSFLVRLTEEMRYQVSSMSSQALSTFKKIQWNQRISVASLSRCDSVIQLWNANHFVTSVWYLSLFVCFCHFAAWFWININTFFGFFFLWKVALFNWNN